ncbi:hypothetical protein Slala02_13060 [Streptomyces lavendulae subsp. lavendulae]|nr:hypothetical protein Slala01_05070 [Streptomyces lavendulae subsp. lavendulae]GLX25486.1 hypothetical protein Slala02_13060 [Streptomyces lavendulae subsp. lavendulae]
MAGAVGVPGAGGGAAAAAGSAPAVRNSTLSSTRTRLFISLPPAPAARFRAAAADKLPAGRTRRKAREHPDAPALPRRRQFRQAGAIPSHPATWPKPPRAGRYASTVP